MDHMVAQRGRGRVQQPRRRIGAWRGLRRECVEGPLGVLPAYLPEVEDAVVSEGRFHARHPAPGVVLEIGFLGGAEITERADLAPERLSDALDVLARAEQGVAVEVPRGHEA